MGANASSNPSNLPYWSKEQFLRSVIRYCGHAGSISLLAHGANAVRLTVAWNDRFLQIDLPLALWSTIVGLVLGDFNTSISTIHIERLRQMSVRMPAFSSALLVKLLTILATIALLAMPHIAKKLVEKFSASDFAAAVIAQNKEVFDRLAEM